MAENADPVALVRHFYECRRTGDIETLRMMIKKEVVWREPEVDGHMGELSGVDAVIDMMERALLATGGTFRLDVERAVATHCDCAAVIRWRADKEGRRVEGRELAIFRFEEGLIHEAQFFPEDIENDHDFWT